MGDARFSWTTSHVDGAVVIELAGELDLTIAPDLRTILQDQARQAAKVVVDMSRVDFMDSSGLRALLELRTDCETSNRPLTMRSPSPAVARVLHVGGVERFFDIERLNGGPA